MIQVEMLLLPPIAFLATIILTSVSSTIGYRRQRRIDYKVGTLLTATTIPGAFVEAHLTTLIIMRALGLIFGFFLILIASHMTFRYGFHELHPNNGCRIHRHGHWRHNRHNSG